MSFTPNIPHITITHPCGDKHYFTGPSPRTTLTTAFTPPTIPATTARGHTHKDTNPTRTRLNHHPTPYIPRADQYTVQYTIPLTIDTNITIYPHHTPSPLELARPPADDKFQNTSLGTYNPELFEDLMRNISSAKSLLEDLLDNEEELRALHGSNMSRPGLY